MAITIAVNKVSNNISISTDDVVISTAEVVQPITVNTAIPSVVFDASYLAVTPSGLVTATNVQGAIDQLAAVTEANDLTTTVTWADVPDANITESSVVQYITSANVSAAGAAMLTGADFTGDVTITNGELTVNGSAEADLFKGDIEGAVHFKGATNGDALTKGDVVYVSGYSGTKTRVGLADASNSSKMPAFGIVAADPVGVNVDVVTFGTLKSIDTSTYTDGDELYVSTTAGQLTATAPSGEGNLVQKIAKVVRAHNSGNIKVMGAGRTNATPNLNDGNFFIGDSNNLATTASFNTEVANATTGKADLSGATFTGDISVPEITADNAEINGGDLVLRSDSTGADTQFIRFENKNDNSRTSFIKVDYIDDDKGGLTFGTSGLVDNVQTDAKKMLSLYHHGVISMYNKNNVRYFTFNEDGRVGIGSSSNSANQRSTSEALNIAGSVRTEGGDLVLEYRHGNQGEVSFTKRDDANNSYRQSYIKPEFFADADDGSGLAFGTAPINASTYSDSITRMFIDAAGNVGINSTQPLEKLDVVGNIAVSGTVDGVDIATLNSNAIVDGDFTSAGIMTTDGSGGYSVDSSTYATETYVDTAVSGLVDSAPATLDTLNELASALGDDANFSTTVTNSLAGKANLSGATFTGNVNIGLPPSGTQSLTVAGSSTLYGGVQGGLDVTGNITVTGTVDGVDVAAIATTANSAMQDLVDDTTPQLGGDLDLNGNDITGTGNINITQSGTSTPALHIYNADTSDVASPTIRLERRSTMSVADDDNIGKVEFYGFRDGVAPIAPTVEYANITGVINDGTTTTIDGQIDFNVAKNDTLTTVMSVKPTEIELPNGTDLDVDGTISATQLNAGVNGITSTGGITASGSTIYGNILQSAGNTIVGGNITVGGTVDGVDVATLNSNALVDGDFTSNGFMKRTGAGTYTVDTNSYVTTGGGTFYGDVTVTGIPPTGEGTLTANFLKGTTTTGGATTPVIDLEKNVTGMSGSGRFIEFNTKDLATSSILTRGHLGINQTSANNSASPYFSHNDGNCGFALSYSGSSSFNSIVPASTLGGVTSSNINLGHQYARWNGIYLKISPNVSSDREYKRDIEELSEAEKRVAVACKGLIRKYRMRDAYEEKGESARLHIGIIAQDLQDAFTAEGLDAHRYGMFCSDTWHQATVTTEDEDGNVTTSVEDFELVEHAPEGATNITEITRLSVRYEELLAFIISTT